MEGAPGAPLLPAPKTDSGGGAGAACGEERSGLAAARTAPEDSLVASEAGRRDRAAASRSRPVEAARALASAAAGPGSPRPNSGASRRAERRGRPPAPPRRRAGGKVWPRPLGRELSRPLARPGGAPPVPSRPALGAGLPRPRTTYSGCSRSDGASAAAILNFLTPRRRWRRLRERRKPGEAEEEGTGPSRMCRQRRDPWSSASLKKSGYTSASGEGAH